MSHTGHYSNEPYDESQPTKAYSADWEQASGGNAPTDEIEVVQEPSDRTRVMDTNTAVYTPTPGYENVAATPASEANRSATSRQKPSFEHVAYQPEPQAFQPMSPQPAFMPHPRDLRKGASAGARVASLVINLVLTALLFLVLWDYSGIQQFDSVILRWFMNVEMSMLLYISLIPIIIGVISLLTGVTLWFSATGTGVFGFLIFAFSLVSASLLEDVGGDFGVFLNFALPILFPVSLLMMGAALGAGLARRAGARRIIRAYTGRL